MMHFAPPSLSHTHFMQPYHDALLHYPEELLCMAYQHMMRSTHIASVPAPDTFIQIIEPEYRHRKSLQHKLVLLLQKMERKRR